MSDLTKKKKLFLFVMISRCDPCPAKSVMCVTKVESLFVSTCQRGSFCYVQNYALGIHTDYVVYVCFSTSGLRVYYWLQLWNGGWVSGCHAVTVGRWMDLSQWVYEDTVGLKRIVAL